MTSGQLILDRYEPLGTAGTGGFGTVRIAWDPRIQRKVAIKTIELSEADVRRAALPGANAPTANRWRGVQPWNEYLAETEPSAAPAPSLEAPTAVQVTALAHLPGLDEARTAAKLSDARIVTVFDFEVRGRTAYLIMEYVEGVTLTRFLADHGDQITLDMVTTVFDAVAGALAVAHKAGVLHLDIKPDNIIISPQGQVKVTDFGLATLADASGAGTTGGGTIGYMPLEQMRRASLDARTDEWSLAALAYEMLVGENPFRAPTLADAERAIEDAELVLPSLCWDGVDEQLDDVLFYALDPNPDERYATVADFAEEMDKFLGDAEAGKSQIAALVGGPAPREGADAAGPGTADRSLEHAAFHPSPARFSLIAGIPERWRAVAGHAFGAAASGAAAWVAASGLPMGALVGDGGVAYAVVAVALVVAAVGAVRPHAGALMAFALLGASVIAAGRPLEGAVLIAVAIAWWYAVARHGMAAANTALLAPIANLAGPGAVAAVPLVAAVALRPRDAIATTAFVAVAWIAVAAPSLSAPATWAAIAGWIAGALALSLLSMRGRRWLTVAGLAVAVACIAIGSIAFAAPTPQLIVALILASAAIIACG